MTSILKEIILRMNDYQSVVHFCKYSSDVVNDLCKTDPDIITHLNNINPSIKLNIAEKNKIKEANKIMLKNLPLELRKQILYNTFDEKLTLACLDLDIDVCEFRNSLCKQELQKLGLKPTDGDGSLRGTFCYFFEEVTKIIKCMKRYGINKKKLVEFTTTSLMQLTFSEMEISSIPYDILDFIRGETIAQKNEEQLKILLEYYQKTNDPKYLNKMYELILNGTNIYIILKFAVAKGNMKLIDQFSQAPNLLNFVLEEAIYHDNAIIIKHIMDSVKENKYPGDDIIIPNLKTKLINYPNLIASIYYYKYNHLLPLFLPFATETDIIKAQLIYETKIF